MSKIRELFDETLSFERRVEKVITFSNREPHILRNEARDYVLTKNLAEEYERLLTRLDGAQSGSGDVDCCVWLSGFYGSGKSSFAKYFGLSFDPECQIEGAPFFVHFKPRFPSQPLQQQFQTAVNNYPCTVFLLDLAAQGYAHAANTPISAQIFDRVCQWAGYLPDRKIGLLISRLEVDGKLDEFKEKAQAKAGLPYDTLTSHADIFIPTCSELAHEYYPSIWSSAEAFMQAQTISTVTDQEMVETMLDLIEKKTGNRRVLFIVDEVGHFLRNNDALINNLDGLAKNLKEIGKGKAWLIATAQQTIPKTGPLYGLRDRFPIHIDLPASDIREITHKRLLKKSAAGAAELGTLFDKNGEMLLHSVSLHGCDSYPKLEKTSFVDFYPLPPMQFEVLINAIGALAKRHGGIGLRSAIRCVEEILLEKTSDGTDFLDQEGNVLITTADLYDILKRDIVANAREITLIVDRIEESPQYGPESLELAVAKAAAVLQQIEGFPTTRQNLAALLHPRADARPREKEVNAAIERLLADPQIAFGETDGKVGFLSEAVAKVEKERATLPATSTDTAVLQNEILKEIFGRPPRATLEQTKTVESGISIFDGNREQEILGGDRDIHFVLRLVSESRLDSARQDLCTESLASANQAKIYLVAALPADLESALREIHQAEEIQRIYRNEQDNGIQRYLEGQRQFADNKRSEIRNRLIQSLTEGLFVFRGQSAAVDTVDADLENACRKKLGEVAGSVYSEFHKASENVRGTVAEAFLKTSDLSQITNERDPLNLVSTKGSATEIDVGHPALIAVLDFFQRHPNPDGRRILQEFTNPPYGWTKDTTRYLLAALFYAQKIKLRVNGDDLTVVGEQSLRAFANNTSFNGVTVALNLQEVPDSVRKAAAKRLDELTGERVIPLPQRIAEVATKYLPRFQAEIQSLPYLLQNFGIDTDRLSRLQRSLNEALLGDGAEATPLFGAPESEIYHDLLWARSLKQALDDGAEVSLGEFADLSNRIESLRSQKLLPKLVEEWDERSADLRVRVREGSFVEDLPALRQKLEDLRKIITAHCEAHAQDIHRRIQRQVDELLSSPAFSRLDELARQQFEADARLLVPSISPDLDGVQGAQSTLIEAMNRLHEISRQVEQAGRPSEPPSKKPEPVPGGPGTARRLPPQIRTPADLDALIRTLEELREPLKKGEVIRLEIGD